MENSYLSVFPILLIFLSNMLILGNVDTNISSYNQTKLEIPKLEFHKYYFESHKYKDIITILSNVDPGNVKVICIKSNETLILEDIVFYPNMVGYKAEFRANCEKIKIEKEGEVIYYRDFSLE